jgi:hypothetical protein
VTSAKMSRKRKTAKQPPSKQASLLDSRVFTKKPKYEKYLDQDVLLTDDIYCGKIPADAKGKHFRYVVTSHDKSTDTFSLRYENQAIDPNGVIFHSFAESKDGDPDIMSGVGYEIVRSGHERYLNAQVRVKKEDTDRAFAVKKKLQQEAKDPTKVDVSDIEAIVEADINGGRSSMDILWIEFEKVDHANNDHEKKQRWRHKSTGRQFWQFRSDNSNTWDSGVWNKCLVVVAAGRLEAKNNIVAQERAKYILEIRGYGCVGEPTKGKGFYSFEEDLPHHINECIVLISTGIGSSFFANVLVHD